jgi:hypothetical protein
MKVTPYFFLQLTRAGRFMKGSAVLFSAAIAVLTRPLVAEGANADADPARRATKAAVFIIFYIWYKVGGANTW